MLIYGIVLEMVLVYYICINFTLRSKTILTFRGSKGHRIFKSCDLYLFCGIKPQAYLLSFIFLIIYKGSSRFRIATWTERLVARLF